MDFTNINIWAVLVAALVSFGLGALWYGTAVFGKTWQKEMGFTDEDLKDANMGKIFGSSFALMLFMSIGMAIMVQGHGGDHEINCLQGLYHGLYVGFFFVATTMGINILYQRRSFKLWAIDAFYQISCLSIMGAILGAWH